MKAAILHICKYTQGYSLQAMNNAEGNMTEPVTTAPQKTALSATPLARWFVQWDNYSIALEDNA